MRFHLHCPVFPEAEDRFPPTNQWISFFSYTPPVKNFLSYSLPFLPSVHYVFFCTFLVNFNKKWGECIVSADTSPHLDLLYFLIKLLFLKLQILTAHLLNQLSLHLKKLRRKIHINLLWVGESSGLVPESALFLLADCAKFHY